MQIFIAMLALFGVVLTEFGKDVHFGRWYVLCAIGASITSYFCAKRVHWSLGLFTLSTLLSSMTLFGLQAYDKSFPIHLRNYLGFLGAYGAFSYMLLGVTAIQIGANWRKSCLLAYALLCQITAFVVIFQYLGAFSLTYEGGWFGNRSIGASFMAIAYPIVLDWCRKQGDKRVSFLHGLPIPTAVIMTTSTVSYIALIISVIWYFYSVYRSKVKLWMVGVFTSLATALGIVSTHFIFFDSGGNSAGFFSHNWRWIFWEKYLEWFFANANPWLGLGNGAMRHYAIQVQVLNNLNLENGYWFHTHNDWLQLFMEQGIIGLGSALILALSAIFVAFKAKSHALGACVVCYCVVLGGNYPTNLAFGAISGMLIAISALKGERVDN